MKVELKLRAIAGITLMLIASSLSAATASGGEKDKAARKAIEEKRDFFKQHAEFAQEAQAHYLKSNIKNAAQARAKLQALRMPPISTTPGVKVQSQYCQAVSKTLPTTQASQGMTGILNAADKVFANHSSASKEELGQLRQQATMEAMKAQEKETAAILEAASSPNASKEKKEASLQELTQEMIQASKYYDQMSSVLDTIVAGNKLSEEEAAAAIGNVSNSLQPYLQQAAQTLTNYDKEVEQACGQLAQAGAQTKAQLDVQIKERADIIKKKEKATNNFNQTIAMMSGGSILGQAPKKSEATKYLNNQNTIATASMIAIQNSCGEAVRAAVKAKEEITKELNAVQAKAAGLRAGSAEELAGGLTDLFAAVQGLQSKFDKEAQKSGSACDKAAMEVQKMTGDLQVVTKDVETGKEVAEERAKTEKQALEIISAAGGLDGGSSASSGRKRRSGGATQASRRSH